MKTILNMILLSLFAQTVVASEVTDIGCSSTVLTWYAGRRIYKFEKADTSLINIVVSEQLDKPMLEFIDSLPKFKNLDPKDSQKVGEAFGSLTKNDYETIKTIILKNDEDVFNVCARILDKVFIDCPPAPKLDHDTLTKHEACVAKTDKNRALGFFAIRFNRQAARALAKTEIDFVENMMKLEDFTKKQNEKSTPSSTGSKQKQGKKP